MCLFHKCIDLYLHFGENPAAFYRARQLEQALLVLQRLTRNAVAEQRFLDAGYYSWILSTQCLDLASNQELRLTGSQCREYLRKFERMQSAASLYYAYGPVFWSLQQPFTALSIDALFNRAKFALHESVGRSLPPSISRSLLLYSLCRHSVTLGAYRFARLLHEQLRSLHLPAKLRDSAESAHLSLRCRPFNDAEELLPLCYR